MQGIHHFIIQAENLYSDTFKTESGVELYGNVDFTAERQSNRVVTVISTPAKLQTEIKKGYELLIDFTPFYRQIYNGVKQGYQNIADKNKHWYWLEPSMIICYRKDEKSDWIGYGENSLVKPILEENTIKTSLLLPNSETKKFTGKVKMIYANKELKEQGVKNGDTLYMDIKGGVKYWIDGKEYWWVRNRDLLALAVEEKLDNEITFSKPTKKDFDSGKYTAGCDPYLLDEVGHFPKKGKFVWKNGIPDGEVEFVEQK